MLGFDGLLMDSYCAGLMGYAPDEIEHLRFARQFGVGEYISDAAEIVELHPENRPKSPPQSSRQAKQLAECIDEDSACSPCYAALIFALDRNRNLLRDTIKIGQGWRDKTVDGIGVGDCAKGCARSVGGCPPRAVDIVEFLRKL
jgi:hypothetical protein